MPPGVFSVRDLSLEESVVEPGFIYAFINSSRPLVGSSDKPLSFLSFKNGAVNLRSFELHAETTRKYLCDGQF